MSTTNYMELNLPEVSATVGPTWASNLNTAFEVVDEHDHSSGKGTKVTTSGLNINADLTLNSKNLTTVKEIELNSLATTTSTVRSIYSVGGELYYNDAAGNSIRFTSGGALDISTSTGIGGDYGSTDAIVNYSDSTKKYSFIDSAADAAPLIVGGLDFDSSGNQNITGTPTFTQAVTIEDSLVFSTTPNLSGNFNFSGTPSIGGSFNYTGTPTIGGNFNYNGSTIDGTLTLDAFCTTTQIVPPGLISAWIGGYFGDGSNGSFTSILGNTVSNANTYLNPKGWYVCDGSAVNDSASPIFSGASRYLPNLTDNRFLMGSTTAGTAAGSNTLTDHTHTHTISASASAHNHSQNAHYHTNQAHSHINGVLTTGNPAAGSTAGRDYQLYSPVQSGTQQTPNVAYTSWNTWFGYTDASYVGIDYATASNNSATSTVSISGGVGTGSAATSTENRPLYLSCLYIMKVK